MRKRKKRFWKPAAAGFLAVYLLTMGLAAFLVKEKFVEEYRRQFQEAAVSVGREASNKEFDMEEEEWSRENRSDYYQSLADRSQWLVPGGAFEISVAFYDEDMKLLARSRDQAGGNMVRSGSHVIRKYMSFALDDYLTQEEKETLAKYRWESIRSEDYTKPPRLRFSSQVSPDEQELWGLYVQEITWEDEDKRYKDPLNGGYHSLEANVMVDYGTGEELSGTEWYETDSRILWQWTDPEVDEVTLGKGRISDTSVTFPYMGSYENGSYKRWKRWSMSPYLQNFPEKGDFAWEFGTEEPPLVVDQDGLCYRAGYKLQIGMAGDPFSYLDIRMESRPWQDAFAYMKYAAMAGLVVTVVCVIKIVSAFNRIYDRQTALEETRRDFVNAMAHELKTPLGVIRSFAENLLEHNMEEKRDYYLTQIIGQTEEMDELVVKMIEVSKLDCEELILKKEAVFFRDLIRQELEKFDPQIREKHIKVSFEGEEDYGVEGDREYLTKAVWNLLANAVDYNIPEGSIWIQTGREGCVIENTGSPLEEETLLHAFDLFYTGDKSRSKEKGHMGMGLYLAKKILNLHNLSLTLENTDRGVRAVIRESRFM